MFAESVDGESMCIHDDVEAFCDHGTYSREAVWVTLVFSRFFQLILQSSVNEGDPEGFKVI